MNIFRLNFNTAKTTERKVEYNVYVDGSLKYTGKAFAFPNATYVDVNIEDVLMNYRYRGEYSIKPTIYDNQYVMDGAVRTTTTYPMYASVRVGGSEFQDVTKTIKLYPEYNTTQRLVSHIPANTPNGFVYVYAYYSASATSGTLYNGTTTTVVNIKKGLNLFNLGADGKPHTLKVDTNKIQLNVIDDCMKPYYLCWLDREGSMVVEPFTDRSEASVEYNTNMLTDTYNSDWIANKNSQNKYKLKSTTLTDAEYEAYGDMFKSPYIVLIDTKNGKMEYVNISDTSFSVKTRKTNDKKPLFLELNVEASEHIKV